MILKAKKAKNQKNQKNLKSKNVSEQVVDEIKFKTMKKLFKKQI